MNLFIGKILNVSLIPIVFSIYPKHNLSEAIFGYTKVMQVKMVTCESQSPHWFFVSII
jgi:hypothetical protein